MSKQTQVFRVAMKAMIIKGDKLLIVYKSKAEAKEWSSEAVALDDNDEVRRDLPGGRLDFGEAPAAALRREVQEETGLEVEMGCPVDVWHIIKDNLQLVGINYLCKWISGEVMLSDEHEAYEWLTEKELRAKGWHDIYKYLLAFEAAKGVHHD